MAFDATIIFLACAIIASLFHRYAPDAYMVRSQTFWSAPIALITVRSESSIRRSRHWAETHCRTSGSMCHRHSNIAGVTSSTGTPRSRHSQAFTC